MKRLYQLIYFSCFILIPVLTNQSLSAQNYVAEYQSIDHSKNATGSLVFNTKEWLYDVTTLMEPEVTWESSDIDVSELNEKAPLTTKPFSTFNFRSLDKNEYLDEELSFSLGRTSKSYVIRGELEKPEWNILSDSVKMIEGYTCLMAKGFVRGRDYTVWFTPDIAVSAGPWKLWGLPGLIVDARADDGAVEFTMTSLKQTDMLPKKPKVAKTVSPEEYKALFQDEIKKFSRRIQSLSDGSTEFTVTGITNTNPDKSLFE